MCSVSREHQCCHSFIHILIDARSQIVGWLLHVQLWLYRVSTKKKKKEEDEARKVKDENSFSTQETHLLKKTNKWTAEQSQNEQERRKNEREREFLLLSSEERKWTTDYSVFLVLFRDRTSIITQKKKNLNEQIQLSNSPLHRIEKKDHYFTCIFNRY